MIHCKPRRTPLRSLRLLVALVPVLLAVLAPSVQSRASASAAPVAMSRSRASAAPAEDQRLIILGFDGGDGRTVEEMMDAGELPNLQRLRSEGTFARLSTTAPAESPTCWASLNTGQNPGKTGVSGFVKRNHGRSGPSAGFGHLVSEDKAIGEFEHVPLPVLDPVASAAAFGGVVLVVFLIVFGVLLKMRWALAGVLSLLLACAGSWAGFHFQGYLPSEIPRYTNPNAARNFWDYAADAGVSSIVLDAAQAFDQDSPEGARVLAGLGVPDSRGGIGDWFIYTDDDLVLKRPPEGERSSTAGTKFRVDWRDGEIRTFLYGPVNFWEKDRIQQELDRLEERQNDPNLGYKESIALRERQDQLEDDLRPYRGGNEGRVTVDLVVEKLGSDRAAVEIDGQRQELAVGEWSDFYHLTFEINTLIKVKAVTRVKLVSLEQPFELFVNTLDIDPASPPFWQSISEPHDFAPELVKTSAGTFETYGWACATMPFKDGEVSPETLLEDIEFTMQWRERVTYAQLKRDDWKLFMSVFSTPDRVQHMTYQYYDEEHPLHDPAVANREMTFFGETIKLKEAVPAIYRQVDRIVGKVMNEHLGPNDTLLICADHGFQSFRRQVSVNNWLHDHGYLAVKSGLEKSDGGDMRKYVDWSNTKAYGMGLGFIYVNEKGRETHGIVPPSEKAALLAQIQADLLASKDPETGMRMCSRATWWRTSTRASTRPSRAT